MRVITTASKAGFEQYGKHWLAGRKFWPKATEFYWYTESYELPYQPDEQEAIERCGLGPNDQLIQRRDCNDLQDLAAWKLKHSAYVAPIWKYDVVAYSHKVFAFADATKDFDGVAVWLDADCVTYREIPEGLMEAQVKDAYIAHYARPGRWTETGLFIVDCAHKAHADFWAFMKDVYLQDRYKPLHHWTDCFVMDAAIKRFTEDGQIKAFSLSADQEKHAHPMAVTELGKYIDHTKGQERKLKGRSPENKHRKNYERARA